jgi:diguanylate cyclase (GGDEF)-like protein
VDLGLRSRRGAFEEVEVAALVGLLSGTTGKVDAREAAPYVCQRTAPGRAPAHTGCTRGDVMKPYSKDSGMKDRRQAAPLARALDQSQDVQIKVEEAAEDLSTVNTTLKQDPAMTGAQRREVRQALAKSAQVEVKVQESADELVTVNDALAIELDERADLEHQLSRSRSALSASRAQEKQSRHDALHDGVTGLSNLTLFKDRLDNALSQAQRHDWRLAVMFIDLDSFKSINDRHGHDVGDRVLQLVARRLETLVRGGDTVSRRGGDEFLYLMLEAKDEANAVAFAATLIERIGEVCEVDGATLTVSSSVGIALYPEDGRSAQELLKHADLAMYTAKLQRKGVVPHSQMPQQ